VNQIAESPPGHFAAQLDIDQLLPLVIGKCREALDAEGVSVLLLDSAEALRRCLREGALVASEVVRAETAAVFGDAFRDAKHKLPASFLPMTPFGNRITFVRYGFTEQNSLFQDDSLLWVFSGTPPAVDAADDFRDLRARACSNFYPEDSVDCAECRFASVGHPTAGGAIKYYEQIMQVFPASDSGGR
jgi:hypothetical protein